MTRISVPHARLAAPSTTGDDQALQAHLAEIRRKLLTGEKVTVNQKGTIQTDTPSGPDDIDVPQGKLAASLHWYRNDPELYQIERQTMARFFPDFSLQKARDGRLSWIGTVQPGALSRGSPRYILLAVYSHNHPSNNDYGGSVRVYVIDPDLELLADGLSIPHTLRDDAGGLYLCTARKEDIGTGRVTTTAGSSIAMAVKWLAAFELWVDGAISTRQFQGHNI